jgi:4-diphosphocytidyl-2-C-methyl-D-erythritol kinase
VKGGARLSTIKAILHKHIPSGAGLGGGSSDGARAMLGIARLWELNPASFNRHRLADLSARCGSDLPFFFHGPSSACTGRGQFVRPVPAPAVARWALLVLPSITMPTPAVYRQFDQMCLGVPDRLAAEPDWSAWASLPSLKLLSLLVNDLEAPAFALRPDLSSLREKIESQLNRPVRMSGSGSSLFTLFDVEADASVAAARIGQKFSVRTVAVEIAPKLSDDLGD